MGNGVADVAVREHGIGGNDAAGQGKNAEQLQGGLVLVGGPGDFELADHGGVLSGERCDEVSAGDVGLATARECLAVEGEVADGGPAALEPGA